MSHKLSTRLIACCVFVFAGYLSATVFAQLIDRTKAPNVAHEGIARPLLGGDYPSEIGDGRSSADPNSSLNVIAYDPFRAIRRGRQLFQRKFTRVEGNGPNFGDGSGNINVDLAIGAGLSDSCASCHGRPRGGAGFGGDVATRPDSRDAPHLYGLGLKEMLGDEITADLRAIRDGAIAEAARKGTPVVRRLTSKGISYGSVRALPDGSVDTSNVEGVDGDLRVRPFFAHGGTTSIREFVVGALKAEMGLAMAGDPDLTAAQTARVVTPAGMVLDGTKDHVETAPDEEGDIGTIDQRAAMVDYLEFYLLNYFKPGAGEQTADVKRGRKLFQQVLCTGCHIPDLQINRDRRVADVDTAFDPDRGGFNRLFATARLLLTNPDSIGNAAAMKMPAYQPYLVHDIYTDFKRHDVGPGFYERNYDGTLRTQFITTPLWGVGTSAPYGHDGRSISLSEVILRHGGEAQPSRDAFAALDSPNRNAPLAFLESLLVFPPDDTASTLDPGDRTAAGYPQVRHGSIRLTVLFNAPGVPE